MALDFATRKHAGQTRRNNGEPYINHPIRVSETIAKYTQRDQLINAALLHDTLEDTDTTFAEIESHFGSEVADLVAELTSDRSIIKTQGKTEYLINKMNNMSNDALLIKLADRLDNVSDLSFDNKTTSFDNKTTSFDNETWSRSYAKSTQNIIDKLKNPVIGPAHTELIILIREKIQPFI